MILKSFRLRLASIYLVVFFLIFSAFVLLLDFQYRKNLVDTVDKDVLRAARAELSRKTEPKQLSEGAEIIRRLGDEYYEFVNREGIVLMTNMGKEYRWPLNKKLALKAFEGVYQFETIRFGGGDFRLLYFPISTDNILRVGESLEDVQRAVAGLERLLLVFFPFVLGISAFVSWFLAGKSVDPVIRIKSLAEEIRHGRLDRRIDIGLKGKEIDDLVAVFNEMLDSIQRSVEARERFTSDVSHEIRSPLTSLRGSIEVMLRKKRTPEEYEGLLRNNLSDIVRLSKIAENLLFFARADSHTLELRKKLVDVNEILKGVIDSVSYEGLSLVEKYHDNIEMIADGDLLSQAFTNLINNAIKYTPPGGTVTVMTEREEDSVKITISDTGVGIPEEEIPHVFERFYRVDRERSRKSGGTGLGLAIAHVIIGAHKGRIMVKSKLGSGSDFIVIFPASAGHD
jgi:signal transduction histidine kinase